VVAPPGLPPARVAELRRAFLETMNDPALRADLERTKLDLEPLAGDALQTAIAGSGDFSPALIARARKIAEMKN
jgi:tripartite-type tricarboxylate transporter receptor subunit TctC